MLHADRVLSSREVVWEAALISATNVLYYQALVAWWTRADTFLRLMSALAASSTLVLFLSASCHQLLTVTSVVAAVGSVVALTLRVPDRVRALGVILAEYVTHASAFERMHNFGFTEERLQLALSAFAETEQREAKDHPEPIHWFLNRCHSRVEKRIGAPIVSGSVIA